MSGLTAVLLRVQTPEGRYRLLQDTARGDSETTTHYNEKPVVFRGRLAEEAEQPREKLTDFLGEILHTYVCKLCLFLHSRH